MPKSVPKFVPTLRACAAGTDGLALDEPRAGRAGGQMGIFFFLLAAVQHLVNAGLMLFVWVAMSRRQQGGTGWHSPNCCSRVRCSKRWQHLVAFFQSINLLFFAPFALL